MNRTTKTPAVRGRRGPATTTISLLTLGLTVGVLGLGVGLGLVIASFIVGVGTTAGGALSATGTAVIWAFVVPTTVLSAASQRRQQSGQ